MERILDRSDTIVGFAARAKGTNKWLRNQFTLGTNRQSLTNDRTVMTIDQKAEIELYCSWYNLHHKTPVEFEIIEVARTTKTLIDFEVK